MTHEITLVLTPNMPAYEYFANLDEDCNDIHFKTLNYDVSDDSNDWWDMERTFERIELSLYTEGLTNTEFVQLIYDILIGEVELIK